MITTGNPPRWLRAGFLADGCFKVLVAGGYAVFGSRLADLLQAPPGLIGATAAPVGASGIAEIVFAVRRGTRSHVGLLAGYDGGWVLVSGITWLVAGSGAAGALWFGYQAIGSTVLTAVFVRGARRASTWSAREPAGR
ncbi:MAG: hypothetical protein ACTH2Q_02975 [Propionibacteriaceae bacterium]